MVLTEDSINSVVYSYLRAQGVSVETQVTTKIYGKTYKPDFYLSNDFKVFGEGEWQKSLATGLSQAATYLDAPNIDASFTLIYPNNLENDLKILSDEKIELLDILEKHSYHIYYKNRNEPMVHELVKFRDFKFFFENILHKKLIPKPDVDVFIDTINQLANNIFDLLPEVNSDTLTLYQNILGSQEDLESPDIDFTMTAQHAAGYLFINQLIFYSILSHKRTDFHPINVNNVRNLWDLKNYFLRVLEIDFKPVFSIDIVSQFPETELEKIKQIIRAIQFLGPEHIESDVIGRVFHKLIPASIRKKVAAYYTMPKSARLLAFFAINDYKMNVIDPACGSGQLLIATYQRMKELYEIKTGDSFGKEMHHRFLENQITGIDIMPFSAHLSLINLTIQDLDFLANYLRIAIYDSTKLSKNKKITPLQSFLKKIQKTLVQFTNLQKPLTEFSDSTKSREKKNRKKDPTLIGSITLDGKAGVIFEIKNINAVIMNPPFTRQELINKLAKESEKVYKKHLIENITKPPFNKYEKYINEQQSFSSYFLFLADKILEDNGIIASVLPATILRDDVNFKLRNYFFKKYSIKYVFNRYDALNFSDDTTFREILLIMEKVPPSKNHNIIYVSVEKLYDGLAQDIKFQEEHITDLGIYEFENFTIQKIPQFELKPDNLYGPIALKNLELRKIWQEASRVKRYLSGKIALNASEGARSRNYALVPEMCIVQELDSRTRFEFQKISQEAAKKYLYFRSIGTIDYKIPISNVFPYCRAANHNKMNLGCLNEYIINKIEDGAYFNEINPKIYKIYSLFQKYSKTFIDKNSIILDRLKISKSPRRTKKDILDYLKTEAPEWTEDLILTFGEKKVNEIIKHTRKILTSKSFSPYQSSWNKYLEKKLCYLGTIETFHIEAPNTYFFAYFSRDHKRVFSSIFNNIINLNEIEAKINCLWLNSALNFLQLFVERVPTGWFKIRQYVLESLKVIDILKLKESEKKMLHNVFEEISEEEFPCIWQQFLRNISEDYISILDKDLICETFNITQEFYNELVNNPFEPRKKLDLCILNIIFPRKNDKEIEDMMNQIYFFLLDEIYIAKKLVS